MVWWNYLERNYQITTCVLKLTIGPLQQMLIYVEILSLNGKALLTVLDEKYDFIIYPTVSWLIQAISYNNQYSFKSYDKLVCSRQDHSVDCQFCLQISFLTTGTVSNHILDINFFLVRVLYCLYNFDFK